MIRNATTADAAVLAEIYDYYVESTIITFESEPIGATYMAARISDIQGRELPWLVAENAGEIHGFALASPYRVRDAFRHTVETSIYLDPMITGHGWGTALYGQLIKRLRSLDIHAAVAAIALPNDPSIALHEKTGFINVGIMKEVGQQGDRWIDVGYWELVL